MSVYYQGSDGCIKTLGDTELAHFKYIKKIGNRYFYTPDELKAYYADEQKKVRREEAFGGNAKDFERRKDRQQRDRENHQWDKERKEMSRRTIRTETDAISKETRSLSKKENEREIAKDYKKIDRQAKRRDRVNHLIDRLTDASSKAERKTRALRKTAEMAATGKEKPKTTKSKYSKDEINSIRAKSWAYGVKREQARKKKKAQQNARNSGAVRAAARR